MNKSVLIPVSGKTSDLRSDLALQRILKNLYHAMQLNESGVKADIDAEFLHNYRVAIRRTRSALSQIRHVLPGRQVDQFSKAFSWLGSITSACRDLDVHLQNFDGNVSGLSEGQCIDLQPLQQLLQQRREDAHETLKKALSSSRYRRFKKSWSTFLDSDVSAAAAEKNAHRPITSVLRKTIWRVYHRVLRQGDQIGPASPAMQYHALRKTCKKLRYLLEFFSSLIPEKENALMIKSLKSLQDNLGDFQNLQVYTETITAVAELTLKDEKASSRMRVAMSVLTANLDRQKIELRDQFSALYRRFRTRKNRDLFKSQFSSKHK